MLKTCLDISECESALQQHLPSIRLLGQLPLDDSDLERIFVYIQQSLGGRVSENLSGVIEDTPAILACYLVWKGIQGYDEGVYWRSLSSELGFLDAGQQARLGKFFREFIKTHDLFIAEIPGSLKNITPILLHGIIPRTMAARFFDQVVYPLARRELVNPGSKEELAFWLVRKSEAAKKVEHLEVLQKKLRRVEEAEKPVTGMNPAQLEQEIQQIEDQIRQEEVDLIRLQAELDAIQYNPTALADLERDLKTVQRLEEEHQHCLRELADQEHALDEMHRELRQYNSLGIVDPLAINDFDTFRHAAYATIIAAIASARDNPDESCSSGARVLLMALCDSVAQGNLVLSDDLVQQLEVLRETDPELLENIEDLLYSKEDTSVLPEPEAIRESGPLLPYGDEAAPAPDITVDPAIPVQSPGAPLDQDPPDEDPTLESRYLPGDPDPGAKTQDAGDLAAPGHSTNDQAPERKDLLLHPTLEPGEHADPEGLLPPEEDAGQEFTTNIPATASDGGASSHPCEQKVPRDPPEELATLDPLEPEAPSFPLEPEPLTRCAENALPPTGRMLEGTSRSRRTKSEGSLQAGSQTIEAVSTLIDAFIDILSQFLRNLRG